MALRLLDTHSQGERERVSEWRKREIEMEIERERESERKKIKKDVIYIFTLKGYNEFVEC